MGIFEFTANAIWTNAILATATYLWGILERRDRTIFGMGYDSAIVLLLYAAGLGLFYFL